MMNRGDDDEGRVRVVGRAEIDTRAPFRSVKEAVALFGEKVLVGEIYAPSKLKEIGSGSNEKQHVQTKIGALTTELRETKQSLEQAKEESSLLSFCIKTLREELEHTKKELQKLKGKDGDHHDHQFHEQLLIHEELKFVENTTKLEMIEEDRNIQRNEFQNKRYVTFASPPSLAQIMVGKSEELRSTDRVKKPKKMRPLVPLLSWLFAKGKAKQEVNYSPKFS